MHPNSETSEGESLNNWEEFIERTHKLNEFVFPDKQPINPSGFLFRGQGNSEWGLDTTLERWTPLRYKLHKYYRDILVSKSQIETLTGDRWEIEDGIQCEKWLKEWDGFFPLNFPGYGFLIYMRHHGFPSPLLDWSISPFVAAYFAFNQVSPKKVNKVSIYAFNDFPHIGKSGSSNESRIGVLGPYVRSHKRHFQQQSQYTICTARDDQNDHCYVPHETVFERGRKNQDLKWKFNLPSTEKVKVLKYLDKHNINAYSLFGSEESLCETMAVRRYLFK